MTSTGVGVSRMHILLVGSVIGPIIHNVIWVNSHLAGFKHSNAPQLFLSIPFRLYPNLDCLTRCAWDERLTEF